MDVDLSYPLDAYAPNGTLWWRLATEPGSNRKFGQERRLAAWLWYAVDIGETFTLVNARDALGSGLDNNSQHFDRRLRKLREIGWQIPSGRDTGDGLRNDHYRLDARGPRYWLAEDRKAIVRLTPPPLTRRKVLERDGHRCVLCGIGARETYPGESAQARMTLGHRIPHERLRNYGQRDDPDNWRTECSRCNEPVRDEMPDPLKVEELMPSIRRLGRRDRETLVEWLQRGERTRTRLDQVYDQVRFLSSTDRALVLSEVSK